MKRKSSLPFRKKKDKRESVDLLQQAKAKHSIEIQYAKKKKLENKRKSPQSQYKTKPHYILESAPGLVHPSCPRVESLAVLPSFVKKNASLQLSRVVANRCPFTELTQKRSMLTFVLTFSDTLMTLAGLSSLTETDGQGASVRRNQVSPEPGDTDLNLNATI